MNGSSFGDHLARAAAHGAVGGVSAEAQGGKFRHGFLAAGVTSLASPAIGKIGGKGLGARTARVAAAAAVGGTASKLGGGKFANGARTAAYLQAFGEAADYYKRSTRYKADPLPGKNDPPYHYEPTETHHQPPSNYGKNVVGWNEELTGNFWKDFLRHDGFGSRALNLVPGINATAGLHDKWVNSLSASMGADYNQFVNFGTTLPSAAVSYSAIAGNYVPRGWMTQPGYFIHLTRPRD